MNQPFDFVKTVFGETSEPVHFSSLGNERDGKHSPRKLDTRDASELSNFITKWDQAERGLFYCVSTIKAGSPKRNKESVAELPMLFADIDLKDVDETVENIERKLKALKFPPSTMIRSGNGVHALWLFKEPLYVAGVGLLQDEVEVALRQLADIVGGDLQVCEVARLMRLPGSHNTKEGAWKEVVVTHQTDARYELDDLEEWFAEQSPIILRKVRPRPNTAKQNIEIDPYLAFAKENGITPPIDVQARLDGMMYMSGGDSSVHATQLAVSSSMLNAGASDEEVVQILLAATKAAAGDYGKRWNWRIEERNLRSMCKTWHKKYTPKGTSAKNDEIKGPNLVTGTQTGDDRPQTGGNTNVDGPPQNGNSNIVGIATAAKPKPKPKPDVSNDDANHIIIGNAVISVIQGRGDDLIFTHKAAWHCTGGLWKMAGDGLNAWLNVEIERAIKSLNYNSNIKLVNEARQWIQRQPKLWRDDIPWDQHGMVPTLSGLVHPRTGTVTKLLPEHYATWRIECEYDPAAVCPWWLQMLEDCFEDRDKPERAATIRVIQELLGAGLIDDKPRELSKALILLGGSNFGKSGLLEVMAGLFGQEQNTTPIEALEGSHGLMPFLRRAPWVLHEAFDQRKWHFSSSVKAIITGEPVQVNVKNGPMISTRIRAPIFWGTNHPPQFKEATKAIINRIVVIECRREFMPERPVGAAVEALKRGRGKPSNMVLQEELPGILRWALDGLRRALEQGFIVLTTQMQDTANEVRKDSNLVAGFLEECCQYDQDMRISVPDFCLAFAAWWKQNKGEDRSRPSNEAIGKALVAMADGKILSKDLRDNKRRYIAGLVLNEEGLTFHQAGFELRDLQDKLANTTDPKSSVNQPIPESWLEKPSIRAMKKRHDGACEVALTPENGNCQLSPKNVTDDSATVPNDSVAEKNGHRKSSTVSKTTNF